MLSLGLAIIFGLINIINFAHGAQYMLGAFGAYFLLNNSYFSIGYWPALIISPILVGALGILIERNLISQLNVRSKTRSLVFLGSFFAFFLPSPGLISRAGLALNGFPDTRYSFWLDVDPIVGYGAAAILALLFTSFLSATERAGGPRRRPANRSPLRAAPDLRPRHHHSGPVPQSVWFIGLAVHHPRGTLRRA